MNLFICEPFARSHESRRITRSIAIEGIGSRSAETFLPIYRKRTENERRLIEIEPDTIKLNRACELTARELHKRYRGDFQLPHIRALRRASNTCAYDLIVSEGSAPTSDSSSIYFKAKLDARGITREQFLH
jgi:hypothetical protein